MAKLVTKFKYLKPSAGENVGGYAKYIATREGVDKIDDTAKLSPATIKQKQLIEKILKDFPDAKEMLEYEDYLANQTVGRASEFISRALEDNADEVMSTKTYADYIATRPRAERFGTHGLFTDDGVQVKLNKVSEELNLHGGNVWTVIISLRREDAERLGYNTGVRWRDMLRTQTESLATNLKIPMENLKWFAAFHNESYHPHVHLIAYSTVENEGYLTKQGVKNLRSAFAKDIFAQDLLCIYEKQTQHRDELRMQSNEIIADIVSRINSESYDNPKVEKMLRALADKLSRTKGKKVYGYLKADVKSMVDAIVDELARDERIAKLYGLWYEQKEEILHIYSETGQRKVPLSQNNEFKTIRNAVISEAMNLVTGKANGEIEGLNEQEIEPQEVTEMMTPDIDITDEDAPMDADEPTDTDEPMKADELMEEQTEGNTESHTATKKGFGYSYKRKKTWWTDEYKLARKYLYGAKDSKPDVEKAFGLMMAEAHKGNGFAIHDVGKMFLSGLGCEKDEVQAQEWFKKAYEAFIKEESKSDNPGYLQYRIGKLYSFGYGVVQDYPKAAEWYEKAVAEKNPFAAYALGSLYHRGQGVMQDEKEAYRLFIIAATNQLKPNAYAQYELGKMCRDGIGTGVDMEASEEWFKRAYQGFEKIESTMADDRLYYRMGQMNYTGTGTDKNYEKARMYYEKALELDNKDALYGLGKLYLNREYERYDMEKAVAYLTESANLGNEYAIRLLQYIKSIKSNSRWSVTVGVTRLFNHMSRILQERLQEEQKGRSMTDRKLKRKIDEKKQAHGLRQG